MGKNFVLAFTVASLLSGCASNSLREGWTATQPGPIAEREATVLTLRHGDCAGPELPDVAAPVSATGALPLVAPLVGLAADFAVNLIGAQLKRLKEGRNAVWVATGGINHMTARSAGEQTFCLSIARGILVRDGADPDRMLPPHLGFRPYPAFIFQADLVLGAVGADKTAPLRATPYKLDYAETSAPVRGKNRKDVSVLVAFSGQTLQPGSGPAKVPETKDVTTVLRLDLGRLQVGRTYDATMLGTVSARAALGAGTQRTVTAVVSESEDSTAALDALLAAFDSNKSDLSAAFKKAVQDAIDSKPK